MVKKINKIFLIIILVVFFISSSYIKVYALTTYDITVYSEGDKFKLIKNGYKYIFNSIKAYRDPDYEDQPYFKKGEIVTYTGNWKSDNHFQSIIDPSDEKYKTDFYVEVKSGNKKGYIHTDNLEVYSVQDETKLNKLLTLKEFVEKNKTTLVILSDKELDNLTNKEMEKLKAYDDDIAVAVQMKVSQILGDARALDKDPEEKMKYLESEWDTYFEHGYDEIVGPYVGYMLGKDWLEYKDVSEEIENATADGKSIAQLFDEKYDEYTKLSDEDKNNVVTVDSYYNSLYSLFWQLDKSEQTDERLEKLDEVETNLIQLDTYIGEVPDTIYQYPGQNETTSAGSLDDMIGDAYKFVDSTDGTAISASSLQDFSKTFYNIFLTIGIIVATLVGSILGIKFMLGGAEEKAHIKELLVPYIVGCIVIFGAFAIWKIVVTILSNSLA